MEKPTPLRNRAVAGVVLYAVLFLFFLQLLSDFVAAIYAFGLLETSMTAEVASVLLLFSPVLLLLFRKPLAGWPLVLLGEAMLVCRVAETMLDTRGRMIVAGLGVGCFMLLLPSFLQRRTGEGKSNRGPVLGTSLVIGLALSILFRVLGSGTDISTSGWTRPIGWILAALGGVLMLGLLRRGGQLPGDSPPPRLGWGRTAGLCLGLLGSLTVLYFAFASPNVIARWTGANYLWIVSLMVLALVLFALAMASERLRATIVNRRATLAWNGLFLLSLVLTILAHQVSFPSDPAAYPLAEPATTALHHVPLVITLLTFPVVLLDFFLLAQELGAGAPSTRALGGGFGLAALVLLVLIFGHVFTTVYDYIPVVGPFFRDRFWLVYLLTGAGMALPVLLVRRESYVLGRPFDLLGLRTLFPAAVALLCLGAVAGVLLTAAAPPAPPSSTNSLTVMTYNVQQGYSEDGLLNFDGQLELIRQQAPDLLGLQEIDTNRIAGGNADLVRYFADRLDMQSYYGPKTVPGTFGIALLSRYPIENARTFYMFSEGEQTATIAAQITVDEKTINVFVTHLGNGGPIVQQEAFLQELAGLENVIAMGDFNFRPDSEQYALTTAVLRDSWLLKWPEGAADQGIDPFDRIDHIFVSPGTEVGLSHYLVSPESDHPAMVSEIGW
jgi:endonuclease/exonuclease/phosphatase family metal-dependent hydrolase